MSNFCVYSLLHAMMFYLYNNGNIQFIHISFSLMIFFFSVLVIFTLEIGISDRTRELNNRDDRIKNLEKIIQEKSATISTLNSQIESLQVNFIWMIVFSHMDCRIFMLYFLLLPFQKKGALDAEELLGKAYTRAAGLEKQV